MAAAVHQLATPRLLLRPMHVGDLGALAQVFADPRVMALFGGGALGTERMERWLQRNLDHQARYGYGLFSVILKAEDRLIGDCGLEHMEVAGQAETELGYDLLSAYWNRGLATEAATAVRDWAFAELRLPRLISMIRQGNRASQRVAEKLGMHLVATSEQHGIVYTTYAIEREEIEPRG